MVFETRILSITWLEPGLKTPLSLDALMQWHGAFGHATNYGRDGPQGEGVQQFVECSYDHNITWILAQPAHEACSIFYFRTPRSCPPLRVCCTPYTWCNDGEVRCCRSYIALFDTRSFHTQCTCHTENHGTSSAWWLSDFLWCSVCLHCMIGSRVVSLVEFSLEQGQVFGVYSWWQA